jgi:hypothetical protein
MSAASFHGIPIEPERLLRASSDERMAKAREGSALILRGMLLAQIFSLTVQSAANVTTWGNPGDAVEASPNYAVSVTAGSATYKPFTYYSYNYSYDKTLDREGKYIKLSFLALNSNEYRPAENNPDTYAHSWTSFDFSGGPVDVQVRILQAGDGLTMPLQSCGIYPSAAKVVCRVVAGDTMRFTLERPVKIAVVPNHRRAFEKLKSANPKRTFEGYRNPLFVFARAPESGVPSKSGPGTLVIPPGRKCDAEGFAKASIIYFEPGVHDYSRFDGDEDFYMVLRKGQQMYLAGGAYVFGTVRSDVKSPIEDMPLLYGRGTLSGAKQRWTAFPYVSTVLKGVSFQGIQITDAHNHITHTNGLVRDVAIVGAWHGNTDGPTLEVPKWEKYHGLHVEDCFVMAADTNLKVGRTTRVRNYTAWQLSNAEPLWIRGAEGTVVEDVSVINASAVRSQVVNFRADTANQRSAVVRNLTVEAPYSGMLFFMPSDYVGPAASFDNVLFENVTVNTPHIAAKSLFGGGRNDRSRLGRVVFRNLVINGARVTAANCLDYFDLAEGVAVGKEIVFE